MNTLAIGIACADGSKSDCIETKDDAEQFSVVPYSLTIRRRNYFDAAAQTVSVMS